MKLCKDSEFVNKVIASLNRAYIHTYIHTCRKKRRNIYSTQFNNTSQTYNLVVFVDVNTNIHTHMHTYYTL